MPSFKDSGFGDNAGSNYHLREKPSGLCADHLTCAFVDCDWNDEVKYTLLSTDLNTVDFNSIKDQLPRMNLPGVIAFPTNVRQHVSAMEGGRNRNYHGGHISVKTSEHNYAGFSTMKTSTQMNMRNFTK